MTISTLLTEAYDNFVTFGDVRSFFKEKGSLLGLTKTLSNGIVFSFEDKFMKKLSDFIKTKLEDSTIKDTDILFTLDPGVKRFKIPSTFETELNIPLTLFKILDSRFAGFTSKTSTDTSSISTLSGYNQGDIDEFLLGIGILTYLTCEHTDQVIPLVQKGLIALNEGVFTYTKDEIAYILKAKLKYPQIITYLSKLSATQLQTLFYKIDKFVRQSNGGWRDIKNKILDGTIDKGSTINIISAGSTDSKMDKSDWILRVESGSEDSKSIETHGISVKSNNKTFHRFSCLNLQSTLDFLSLFQIELSDMYMNILRRMIKMLKDSFAIADDRKAKELVTQGKDLCAFIVKLISNKFDKLTAKDKISAFILTPIINAIKGLDSSTHVIPFTVSDIKKGTSFVVGSTDFKFDSSDTELLKTWMDLGKRLSLKYGYDPDEYPTLYVFLDRDEVYRIRFTKSHLSSTSPKITGMFEIVDFGVVKTIIDTTTGNSSQSPIG